MNRALKWSLVIEFLLVFVACLAMILVNLNAMQKMDSPQPVVGGAQDIRRLEQEMKEQLRNAPWQGLRFLRAERAWRFYGVAAETRQINLIQPVRLVKVYYLSADGELSLTWAATEIQFPGQPVYALAAGPIQAGQLIGLQVQGEHVTQKGVFWEACPSEYCHLAERIDSMIVLDELGTGLSNGFIRHGWEPPADPLYGFLCWQIISVENTAESLVMDPQE